MYASPNVSRSRASSRRIFRAYAMPMSPTPMSAWICPEDERRSDEHAEHGGVDRMSHDGVWSGANELVIPLRGDGAAPVLAEVSAGPDGERERSHVNGQSCGDQSGRRRHEARGQQGNGHEEQQQCAIHEPLVHSPRFDRLGASRRRYLGGGRVPVNYERDPESGRNPQRRRARTQIPDQGDDSAEDHRDCGDGGSTDELQRSELDDRRTLRRRVWAIRRF